VELRFTVFEINEVETWAKLLGPLFSFIYLIFIIKSSLSVRAAGTPFVKLQRFPLRTHFNFNKADVIIATMQFSH
jgi:hypothetical protein